MNYSREYIYNRLELDEEKWSRYIQYVCFYNPKPIPIEMETMFLNRKNIGKLWIPVVYPDTFKHLRLHDQRQMVFTSRKHILLVSEFCTRFVVEGLLSEFEYTKLFDWKSNCVVEYWPSEFLLIIREYYQNKTYCIQLYPVLI